MMRYASEWQIFYRPKLAASVFTKSSHTPQIISSCLLIELSSQECHCGLSVCNLKMSNICVEHCNSRVQAEWKLLNPFFNSSTRRSEQLKIYGSEHCGCLRCVKAVWNMTGNLLRPLHWLCYSNSTPLLHIILKCLKGFNTGLKNDSNKEQKQ